MWMLRRLQVFVKTHGLLVKPVSISLCLSIYQILRIVEGGGWQALKVCVCVLLARVLIVKVEHVATAQNCSINHLAHPAGPGSDDQSVLNSWFGYPQVSPEMPVTCWHPY